MVSKIIHKFLIVLLVRVYVNGNTNTKSNVAFVIDDTASMGSEIKQVIEKAEHIFNAIYASKTSTIGDFILVTFNDYEVVKNKKITYNYSIKAIKLLTVTSDPKEFLTKLKKIKVSGGGKCPELSMAGIKMALENSNINSYVYVFTDASAKDYDLADEVENLAHQKSIQITFLLTGVCKSGLSSPEYKVYKQLAKATSGEVFQLNKNDIKQITDYIIHCMQNPQTPLLNVPINPGTTNLNVQTDSDMKNVSIKVNVQHTANVNVAVTGPNNVPTTTNNIVNIKNTKVVVIPNPGSGTYVATVNTNGVGQATVKAAISVDFKHGFSVLPPTSLKNTKTRPVPDKESYLAIQITSTGDVDPELQTVQILDEDDNELMNVTVDITDDKDKYYVTVPFNPPKQLFKVAIIVINKKTGEILKRISRNPVTYQKPPDNVQYKAPEVTIENSPKILLKYGDTVILNCNIKAYPKPTIVWEDKDTGMEIPSQVSILQVPDEYISTLKLDNVNKIGSYTCKATSDRKDVASDFIQVEIVKPRYLIVLESPKDTSIDYQKDGEVFCKIDAWPTADIVWYKDNKELANDSDYVISGDKSTLSIKQMHPKLEGQYYCKATNNANSLSMGFTVSMSGVEPPIIDKTKSTNTVVEGSKADISCGINKGFPSPSIAWEFKKHDGNVFISLATTQQLIQIDPVELDNAGVYKCRAKNIAGEDFHEILLAVNSIPKIDKSKADVVAKQGSRAVISCRVVKGIPEPDISWEFRRKDTNDFLSLSDTTQEIIIDKADVQNAGVYKCNAKNGVGKDSHETELTVQYSPEIDKTEVSKTVNEGTQTDIPCNIMRGFPVPVISWTFKRKSTNQLIKLAETGPLIHINAVTLQNAGVYKCLAKNFVGEDDHEFQLDVNSPPEIDKSKTSSVVKQGSKAVISCRISKGVPEPEVTWEFKADGTKNFVDLSETGPDLTIASVDSDNAGILRCVAKNKAGQDSHETELFVQYPPIIDKSKNAEISIQGNKVSLACSIIKGNPMPRIIWEFKKKASTQFITLAETNPELEIDPVKLDKSGIYKCHAKNIAGEDFHEIELTVHDPPVIDKSKRSDVFMKGSRNVIECSVIKGTPAPLITWEFKSPTAIQFIALPETNLQFYLDPVELDNTGVYKCHVKNDAGDDSHEIQIAVHDLPTIDKSITSNIALKGTKAAMSCRIISGTPSPSIEWEFKSKTANNFITLPETNPELHVDPVDLNSDGVYKCRSKNVAGEDSHEMTLTVNDLPKIDKSKTTDIVIRGSKAIISCSILSGTPSPLITWEFKSQTASKFTTIPETKSDILIDPAELVNAGVYKCHAKNDAGEDSHEIDLNVHDAPVIDKSEVSVTSKTGSKAVISCRMLKGTPTPEVTWEFKGQSDSNFKSFTNAGPAIHVNVKQDSAGIYKCNVKNVVGKDFHVIELIVHDPPVIDKSVSTKTSIEGSKAAIACRTLKGIPPPSVTWEFKRQAASVFVNLPDKGPEIILDPVELDNAGVYKCHAKNIAGKDFHETEFIVNNAPNVVVNPPVTAKIGETVTISCDVSGDPTPAVRWIKDNTTAIVTDQKYKIFNDNSLRFIASINGKGNYTCEAKNSLGSDSKNVTLNVYGPVKIDPPQNSPLNPDVGSDIELICKASGIPPPTITWTFHSLDPNIGSKVLSSQERLTLNRVQESNTGMYVCEADNGYDKQAITYDMFVNVPVEIEHSQQTEFDVVENDFVAMIPCKAKGYPKPKITWTKNFMVVTMGNSYAMDSDGTLIIKNPDMSMAGKYLCIAEHDKSTAFQLYTVNVTPYPTSSGPKETIYVEEKTSPEIKCKLPHQPTDKIRWYTKGKQIPLLSNQFILRDATISDSGEYSCRVSSFQGSQAAHYKIEVGVKPYFLNKKDSVMTVPFIHGINVILECHVTGKPEPTITWWHNGVKLEEKSTRYTFAMNDSHIGDNRCEAKNDFGSISRTFVIKITGCTINYNEIGINKYHPVLFSTLGKLAQFENQNGVMIVPEREPVHILCPNDVQHGYCLNNEFIIIKKTTQKRNFKYEDLKCNSEVEVSVGQFALANYPCSSDRESRLVQIGYNNKNTFCGVYDVCMTQRTQKIFFIKYNINRYASNVRIDSYPFDDKYMFYDYFDMFECTKQSRILRNGCCFIGKQLVTPEDVGPGIQKSTYLNLNVIPQWNFCSDGRNFIEVEKRLRSLAKSTSYNLEVFSGEHQSQNLYLEDYRGNRKIMAKYIWKVVQIRNVGQALAIIVINVPNLTPAEAIKLVFCKDICDLTDWMTNPEWHIVHYGYTFCCHPWDFARKVNRLYMNLFKSNVIVTKNI